MNKYKKAGIPLNTELVDYGTPDENEAFHAMQKSVLLLAEQLLSQEDGAIASIQGRAHWVSPIGNLLYVINSPEIYENDGEVQSSDDMEITTVFDIDGIDVDDILDYKKEIDDWLESPVFYFADQDKLDKAALTYQGEEEIVKTKAFINAIMESQALEGNIVSNNQQEGMGF